jgi:hypothetical protein
MMIKGDVYDIAGTPKQTCDLPSIGCLRRSTGIGVAHLYAVTSAQRRNPFGALRIAVACAKRGLVPVLASPGATYSNFNGPDAGTLVDNQPG